MMRGIVLLEVDMTEDATLANSCLDTFYIL